MLDTSLFKEFDQHAPVQHGLPGIAYTSDEFLHLENRYLLSRHWILAGFVHELTKPGDLRPVQVAGMPLLLVRDGAGEIRAFHNICRHRNLQLVAAAGNCGKLIRCPYHSWSYDLCGRLKNAPYFGGGAQQQPDDFDFADQGLISVPCAVWHDWIFVNLAPEPVEFEFFLAPIKRLLGECRVENYQPVAMLDFGTVACNWKLLIENFIEPYHVQFVHSTTTKQPLESHRTLIEGHCLGCVVDVGGARKRDDFNALAVSSHFLTLFPSFIFGRYQPDQLGVYLHQPVDAGHTRQRRVIYTHRDATYSDAQIRQLRELWHRVHREDHEMCARMQAGRHSPLAAGGGVLSPHWENGVRRFQELVADAVRPALIH